MEQKLTLVSFMCKKMHYQGFVYLTPDKNGKVNITSDNIDYLFNKKFGNIPKIGDTISIGI